MFLPIPYQESSLGRRLGSVSLRYDASHAQPHGAGLGWPRSTTSGHAQLAAGDLVHDADAGVAPTERMARLEAVLFLAKEPLPSRKLSQLANLADGTEARTLIRRLRERYDARGSSFQVMEVAGGFQLLTRSQFAGWLRRLQGSPVTHPRRFCSLSVTANSKSRFAARSRSWEWTATSVFSDGVTMWLIF